MKIDKSIRSIPWPERYSGKKNKQECKIYAEQRTVNKECFLIVTVCVNDKLPWACEIRDFRLVCSRKQTAVAVFFDGKSTGNGKSMTLRKALTAASLDRSPSWIEAEFDEGAEKRLLSWLGVKKDVRNHGLMNLDDWTQEAVQAEHERRIRMRDDNEEHNGLIVSEAAEAVKSLAAGHSVTAYLAPPDLWNARQETGKSVADIFAEHGVYLTKTSNDRVDGWMAVKEWLKVRECEDGVKRPRLRFFPNCRNIIRCLPLLQYDERRVNDVRNEPHEITHAPDALRGFCVYWTVNGYEPAAPARVKLIDQLQPKHKRRYRR